jgi:hypothetical protein
MNSFFYYKKLPCLANNTEKSIIIIQEDEVFKKDGKAGKETM